MMRPRCRLRPCPPWWPENEPWPPSDPARFRRHGGARFVRRFVFLFATLLGLSALGAFTLVSRIVGTRWPVGPVGPWSSLAVVLGGGLFLLAMLSALVRRVGAPLGDIVAAADRVAGGDYTTRVREHGPPSLRTVGRAFNGMAERLQSQDRQRRNMMADIAHELRTPLSVVQGRLEGLLDGVYARDDAQLGELLDETRLLARLVDDLRTLADTESGTLALHKEPTDVTILIQEVVASFSAETVERRLAVRVDASADLPLVSVDPLRLHEVLANLVSNALRHTPPDGVVSIAARVADSHLTLTVSDTGSGIAADDLPKIFDRFYKGRLSRGSGLGLTIARNLVRAHGGEITVDSRVGQGATFRITLPLE